MKDTMLNRLLKGLGVPEATATEANTTLQAEFDAFKLGAEATQNELAGALEKAVAAVSEADTKVAELTAALAEAEAKVTATVEAAGVAKLATRKAKIVAAVGTGKSDALMAATEQLGDEQFDAVVSALALSVADEASSKMFTEQGAAVEANQSQVVEESEEMKILRNTYQKA